MTLQDQTIVCGCGKSFLHSVRDQEYYMERSFTPPKRCKECRIAKKERVESSKKKRDLSTVVDAILSGERVNLN